MRNAHTERTGMNDAHLLCIRALDRRGLPGVQAGCGGKIDFRVGKTGLQLHKRRDSFMSFPSNQNQSTLFTQYFSPLSGGRAHLPLYLVKDPGRQKVHEDEEFHLTFKHQQKTSLGKAEWKFLVFIWKFSKHVLRSVMFKRNGKKECHLYILLFILMLSVYFDDNSYMWVNSCILNHAGFEIPLWNHSWCSLIFVVSTGFLISAFSWFLELSWVHNSPQSMAELNYILEEWLPSVQPIFYN